jgi:hypothetical protein
MPTPEQQQGRSSQRAGRSFNRDAAAALRKNGWPNADVAAANQRGDINGAGDINVECKTHRDWRDLAAHIGQAARDAAARDLPTYVVWRKRHGYSDPMEGYCVMLARDFWRERQRMEELEAVEREYLRMLDHVAAKMRLEAAQ